MNEIGVYVNGVSFLVYRNLEIKRRNVKTGEYKTATPRLVKRGRNKEIDELIVTYQNQETGISTSMTAKKVIADAFIPKEPYQKYVGHIDGDYMNLAVENLYRYSTKKGEYRNCMTCGRNFYSIRKICKKCSRKNNQRIQKQKAEIQKIQNRERKVKDLKESFSCIDIESLPLEAKKMVEYRIQGRTLESIGEEFNLTRERVRQILNKAKEE